jgi:predicted NUDIX family phosphoesterase
MSKRDGVDSVQHPHFNGRPILVGDLVKFKTLDGAKWKWQEVRCIIAEEAPGGKTFPPYVLCPQGDEIFTTKKQAENSAYETYGVGYITGHQPKPEEG